MNEQFILLIFLIAALVATLGLYSLKTKKQKQYKNDERWQLIQLKANNATNISLLCLILAAIIVPFFVDRQTTLPLQRFFTFAMVYVGFRNLIELIATIYFDKQL